MSHPISPSDHRPAAAGDGGQDLALSLADAMRLPAKLRWRLVGYYRASGELAAAAALLDEIEAQDGETGTLLEERARLAFAAGDVDTAATLLEARVERGPSASARVALARLYLEAGDLAAAGPITAELADTDPALLTVRQLVADVQHAIGDLDTARAWYRRTLRERPHHVASLLGLARLALEEGDDGEAGRLLEAILAGDEAPSTGQLAALAELAEELGQGERAASLRAQAAEQEAARQAAFVQAVRQELGRTPGPAPATSGRPASPPPTERVRPQPAAAKKTEAEDEPVRVEAPVAPEIAPEAIAILRRDFGHEALRPGQAAAIANVLAGRDTLAIMPTGAGKSLTFQLPAMLLAGTTLVISPLIALMKDQVENLPPPVRERTTLINSTLAPDELRRRLDALAAGAYKLVYAAPERLRQYAFLRALRETGASLVVIDEAHCITLWGHDFRPDYLAIPKALPELGNPPLLAITATATPAMARAIAAGLGRDLARVQVSLFRPNLFYEVNQVANREAKVTRVIEICRRERGSGIVYVSSRKDAEAIAGLLRSRGVNATPYHAGLDPEIRAHNQERFMRGQARVVVATVAFGMGVNKADVRFIVHLNPPRSLEAYAQESGRAGRDGKPARCVLLTAPADRANLNRLARRDELDLDTLRRVYAGIKRAASGRWAIVDPMQLLPPTAPDDDPDERADPRVALGILEQAGLVLRHPDAPLTQSLRRQPALGLAHAEPLDPASREAWARFAAWSGWDDERGGLTVPTADACAALDLTPTDLALLLGKQPDLVVRDGPRAVCLELLPVQGNATETLTNLLDQARKAASRRISQVMVYAAGDTCRHLALARHLGEAIAPCQTACDVCTGTVWGRSERGRPTAADAEQGVAPETRSHWTAADALAVLDAVGTLPFPMGRTGLTKLLVGSVESRVRADRSRSFGALAALSRGKVDSLIDRLVEDGFLFRDLDHEFKLITLTERGAAATLDDLAAYEPRRVPRRAEHAPAAAPAADNVALDGEDEALYERLRAWRHTRAVEDAVPPYVVAHDAMLRDVARFRPATPDALGQVKGFGPARVEKYGADVLGIIAEE